MNPAELLEAMKTLNLNQTELATRLELTPRTLRRYVAGESWIPVVVEYAIAYLLEHRGEAPPKKKRRR